MTSQRFRAFRDGEVVRLEGTCIHSTPIASILSELCDPARQRFDLFGFESGSWVAMRAVYDAMVASTATPIVEAAGASAYHHFVLLDREDRQLTFASADHATESGGRVSGPADAVVFDAHGFASLENQRLAGHGTLVAYHAPTPTERRAVDDVLPYIQFTITTNELACAVLSSLVAELTEIADRLAAQVSVFDRGFEAYIEGYAPACGELTEFIARIPAVLDGPLDASHRLLARLQEMLSALRGAAGSESELLAALDELTNLRAATSDIAVLMESSGLALGNLVAAFSYEQTIFDALDALEKVDGACLESMRDTFEIMDIEGDDDWGETCSLLRRDADSARAIGGELLTTLQGFDLARQILEHRVAELDMLATLCGDPDAMIARLHDEIASRLVSDQESAAYGLLFPDEAAKRALDEREAPGEMLMFF